MLADRDAAGAGRFVLVLVVIALAVRPQQQEFHAAEPARVDTFGAIAAALRVGRLAEIQYAEGENGLDQVLVESLAGPSETAGETGADLVVVELDDGAGVQVHAVVPLPVSFS